MKKVILLLLTLFGLSCIKTQAQMVVNPLPGNLQRCTVINGDTVILVYLRNVTCFPKKIFRNSKEEALYWRTVRDVKKTLPLAKLINGIMIETYEYLETLPSDKAREKHLKKMQKELFEEYKPTLKKLNYRQARLLIKLIDRECQSSSYELIKAYLGGFAAGFWQGFGKMFGVSLKGEWEPQGKDKETEQICFLVEYGII